MVNTYSDTWFKHFLETIPDAQTAREVAFLTSYLPLPAFRRVLDLACGEGRHARPLADRGYAVTGVDNHPYALAAARAAEGQGITYVEADMRDLSAVPGPFDGALCLSQSWGYFDAATNTEVLRALNRRLRPGGRLVLDLFHRDFFAARQGPFERTVDGRPLREDKRLDGDRLTVTLTYDDGTGDTFAWQVFTPAEITRLAAGLGFVRLVGCANWDPEQPPSAEVPRVQYVFERRASCE